ncbi:hypothetical protein [Methanosarcina sp. KYL-1]|nr:hypothetical protein [Methanosarcina sp. KYL-1]
MTWRKGILRDHCERCRHYAEGGCQGCKIGDICEDPAKKCQDENEEAV